MAEVLVSAVLEQLASILRKQIEAKVSLVVAVDEEVQKLTSNFQAIQAVLEDAENRQVKENAVKDWLDKLTDISYDVDDVLDEWNTAIQKMKMEETGSASNPVRKVCSCFKPSYLFCCTQVFLRHDIATKIKSLNMRLDVIALEKQRFGFSLVKGTGEFERQMTTSVIDVSEVHGRRQDKNTLVNLLLSESSQELTLPIISIVGMGGIGKTTLVRLVFNDDKIKNHFEKRIWVCVSDPFNEFRIAKAILESLTNDASNLVELETILQNIHQYIEGKKFLLVLDDVWTEDPRNFEQLKHSLRCGSLGSRILLTTRKESVANIIGSINMISLGTLSEVDCWSLFSQVAFFGRTHEECEKLTDAGRKIVGKCKGLPLAVKTLGSLLRLKRKIEEWQNVLESDLWELEEVERGLFPPLLLSYYDLPSALKMCFSYCAIFPKGYEIEKDRLIKFWMAQNYLSARRNKDMELVGEDYFKSLAIRSFFQDFRKSEYDNSIIKCKMHDIVHDFAQFLTKNECFTLEFDCAKHSQLDSSLRGARHSMIMVRGGSFPTSIFNERRLRSVLIDYRGGSMTGTALSKLFNQLTCPRVLELSNNDFVNNSILEFPRGIKQWIHLRYLSLSYNEEIQELPETLCELYNLQTLELAWCRNLRKLPKGMGKLINLRHLVNDETSSLSYMPKGIERLTCLRTLSKLIPSQHGCDTDACTLACLKGLNCLQGYLCLEKLGNVTDVDEAKKAELNKKNLLHLDLKFDVYEEMGRTSENDEALLEALQPPPNLDKLRILYYTGNTLSPNWIVSLIKVRQITLSYCMNCQLLPPLGKLPFLESLTIRNMGSVNKVGSEFLGIESDNRSSCSYVITFPKLRYLYFGRMNEWEEWDNAIKAKVEEGSTIMPCLRSLEIVRCPKLKELPRHLLQSTALETLEMYQCPILEKRYKKGIGEDWLKISHIPNIVIDFEYVQENSR